MKIYQIKDETSYQKALAKIYDLMQLESLTDKQGKTLDKLAKDVELYEAYEELKRLKESLKSAEEDIRTVEALEGVSEARKNYLLWEARKRRTSIIRQFGLAHHELAEIKKGGE